MTAANGAEQFYDLSDDDTIRNETAEQAFGLDQRLIEVQLWRQWHWLVERAQFMTADCFELYFNP